MNPISITVTGRLGDDPRTFTTRDGSNGVERRQHHESSALPLAETPRKLTHL